MSMQDKPALVSVPEVARRLGLSEIRCYQLVKDDALPSIRLKRTIKFDPDVIEQWIANGGARQSSGKDGD